MKYILFILMITGVVAAQQNYTYSPLSSKQKRLFEQSAQAIEIANRERNTEAILRFAPAILSEFQNILLDPGCRELRPSYKAIQDIYNTTKFNGSIDSVQSTIAQNFNGHNFLACIDTYQTFYPRIKAMNNDSLLAYHRSMLINSCKKFYESKPSYETIKQLQQYSIVNPLFIDSLKKDLESREKDVLLRLSSERSIDSLLSFKKNYPGLYEKEVDNLIINYRAKWRLAIKRKPNVTDIESYLAVYPEKDPVVDSLYELSLFRDFRFKKTVNSGMKYLSNFPDGTYALEVQDAVRAWDSYTMRDTTTTMR